MRPPTFVLSPYRHAVSVSLAAWASVMVADSADLADNTTKDHAIFVGATLVIGHEFLTGKITNVINNEAEIAADGIRQRISLRDQEELRVKRTPIMSTTSVTIANQKGIRMFSPSNNPSLKAAQNQMLMANIRADKLIAAEASIVRADVAGASMPRMGPGASETMTPTAERSAAALNYASVLSETSGELYDPGMHAAEAQEEASKGMFDMYQITFDISSPEVINDAYVAMITTVILPDTPGQTALAVTMREIGTITPTPRRIRLADGGLRPGFTVEKCEVHIYVQGQEIATNNSDRLVRVSRSEAFQFLLIQHLMAHRNQDVSVTVAYEMLPLDFSTRLRGANRGATVGVHVNEHGEVDSVEVDPALDAATASYVETAVTRAHFFPALAKGEPTSGDATFTLSELTY